MALSPCFEIKLSENQKKENNNNTGQRKSEYFYICDKSPGCNDNIEKMFYERVFLSVSVQIKIDRKKEEFSYLVGPAQGRRSDEMEFPW